MDKLDILYNSIRNLRFPYKLPADCIRIWDDVIKTSTLSTACNHEPCSKALEEMAASVDAANEEAVFLKDINTGIISEHESEKASLREALEDMVAKRSKL